MDDTEECWAPPDLQEHFWKIEEARVASEAAANALRAEEDALVRAHPGVAFRVFRPEWVHRMRDDSILPLFPEAKPC